MTDYNAIPAADMLVGAKPKASTILALSNNPLAMFEGASGAPKLQAAALDTDATMNSWVAARYANTAAGAIGSIAWLIQASNTTSNISAGSNYAGSGLRYSGIIGGEGGGLSAFVGGTPSGTWKALGTVQIATSTQRSTAFLRVA